MEKNVKIGLTVAIVVIALFVLSLLITSQPANDNNSIRFGILTLLPPLVAIGLALITKETVSSLFIGVFIGEFMLCANDLNIISTSINAFLKLGEQLITSMADPWNAGIILQTLFMGGIIHLVARMGGAKALAEAFSKKANTVRKAQLFTWILGILIVFDDYATSIMVGPIMRPITDRLKVSREKLAFIVDSSASPAVSIFIVTTWIGLQLGVISTGLEEIGLTNVTAFSLFIQSLPYMFYNIFIMIFIGLSIATLYEFGPMKKAEQEARKREKVEKIIEMKGYEEFKPLPIVKISVWNAIIPIGTLIIGALITFYWSGYTTILSGHDQTLITLMKTSPLSINGIIEAYGASNAATALLQAALLSSIVTILMATLKRILTLEEAVTEWVNGMKPIIITTVILLFAWSLGSVIGDVGTADYLISSLSHSIPKFIIPALIFVLGAIISFSTGTSFGTMSILMPLAIPLSWAMSTGDIGFVIMCIGGVFSGAVFGDHCSPISDTTILSSMGTSCVHINHVTTQMYYAVFVGCIAVFAGFIPIGLGVPWYLCIPIGAVALYIGLKLLGEKVEYNENST